MKRVALGLVILALLCLGTIQLIERRNRLADGFKISQVYLGAGPQEEDAVVIQDENLSLRELFQQKFIYLGKGKQVWAFVSEDGQHVLKFCRHHPFHPRLANYYPFSLLYQEEKQKQHNLWMQRLKHDIRSYKLAYEHMKEETGLELLHLRQTDQEFPPAILCDKLGREYSVDLNKAYFVIQKRAYWIIPTLTALMEQGKVDQVRQRLSQLIKLVSGRCQKGIYNNDYHFFRNSAFTETGAVDIDVGQYEFDSRLKDPATARQYVYKALEEGLKPFVKEDHPELVPLIDEQLRNL